MTRRLFLSAIRCGRLIKGDTKLVEVIVIVPLSIVILAGLIFGFDRILMGG